MDINTKVNANLHPDKIQGDSQSAKSARHAMETLYVAQGKILDLHEVVHGKALLAQRRAMAAMPAPAKGGRKVAPALIYDQGAADHIVSVGEPVVLKALKVADTAITSLKETAGRLDVAISQKVTAGKNPARGPELRAWAAAQDSPFQALGILFQSANENATLVAEVLGAEHFLSGLTPANMGHLRTVAASVLAPDEVQARKEASEAVGHLTTAAQAFTETSGAIFTELQSPTAGVIDSIVSQGEE